MLYLTLLFVAEKYDKLCAGGGVSEWAGSTGGLDFRSVALLKWVPLIFEELKWSQGVVQA